MAPSRPRLRKTSAARDAIDAGLAALKGHRMGWSRAGVQAAPRYQTIVRSDGPDARNRRKHVRAPAVAEGNAEAADGAAIGGRGTGADSPPVRMPSAASKP